MLLCRLQANLVAQCNDTGNARIATKTLFLICKKEWNMRFSAVRTVIKLNSFFFSLSFIFNLFILGEKASNEESKKEVKVSANAIDYFCSVCNKSLKLSSIEVLKHKKSHMND